MWATIGEESYNMSLVKRAKYNPAGPFLELFFMGTEHPFIVDGEAGRKLWEHLKANSSKLV